MSIAQVSIQVDKDEIQEQIKQFVKEELKPHRISWNIDQIAESTGIKKEYLYKHIMKDARIEQFRRQNKGGLSVWLYEGSFKALQEILNDWD